MEVKQKQHVSREELVAQLRKIATKIKKGSVTVEDTIVQIPDEVELELEIEEVDGKIQFEIEIEWGDGTGESSEDSDESEEESESEA